MPFDLMIVLSQQTLIPRISNWHLPSPSRPPGYFTYFWLLLLVQRHLVGSYVITKYPPFDTVSTIQAVVESWHTWMIDTVHQIRIKCMFETIDRTRSSTSNKFWQGIKYLNGMPPETIIGKCARSTNIYMRDNTISSSTLRMGAYYGF